MGFRKAVFIVGLLGASATPCLAVQVQLPTQEILGEACDTLTANSVDTGKTITWGGEGYHVLRFNQYITCLKYDPNLPHSFLAGIGLSEVGDQCSCTANIIVSNDPNPDPSSNSN